MRDKMASQLKFHLKTKRKVNLVYSGRKNQGIDNPDAFLACCVFIAKGKKNSQATVIFFMNENDFTDSEMKMNVFGKQLAT